MKKIISLFKRDYQGNYQAIDEVVPGAEWVLMGEGKATRKWDGTCCMIEDGKLFKRYDAKKGKIPPEGFRAAQSEPDPITKHWPGWLAVGEGPEDKWFREVSLTNLENGTYELIGPKINGNPEKVKMHQLIKHGQHSVYAPRDFDSIKKFFEETDIEGIVWHHSDGRMVKIKAKDFGIKR